MIKSMMSIMVGLNFGNAFADAIRINTPQGWVNLVFAIILTALWFIYLSQQNKKKRK